MDPSIHYTMLRSCDQCKTLCACACACGLGLGLWVGMSVRVCMCVWVRVDWSLLMCDIQFGYSLFIGEIIGYIHFGSN